MRKEFLQNVAGLFLVSFCYINVITSFWDKCLNKWEENHDLFSKVIGTRCMKVIGQTQENHFKSFLKILVKSVGWTNSLLLSSLWMQKKSQKVQLSMSLCASASTLYFGKFWYWCIILDHLPNVVYIYTQYTKLSRQTKYWSDANTCIGIDTIDMWIVAPTCSPNTVHTGKSTFTFTINMMLKTNIQIDSCLKKQISHIGLLAHTKCKAIS